MGTSRHQAVCEDVMAKSGSVPDSIAVLDPGSREEAIEKLRGELAAADREDTLRFPRAVRLCLSARFAFADFHREAMRRGESSAGIQELVALLEMTWAVLGKPLATHDPDETVAVRSLYRGSVALRRDLAQLLADGNLPGAIRLMGRENRIGAEATERMLRIRDSGRLPGDDAGEAAWKTLVALHLFGVELMREAGPPHSGLLALYRIGQRIFSEVRAFGQASLPEDPDVTRIANTLYEEVLEPLHEIALRGEQAAEKLDACLDRDLEEPRNAARRLVTEMAGKCAALLGIDERQDRSSQRSIWQIAEEIGRSVPQEEWDKLPTDGARNVDHYLYGAPKRE